MLRDKHVGIFFSDPRSIHAALVLVCCAGIITIRDAGEGTEVQAEEHPELRVLLCPSSALPAGDQAHGVSLPT